jgi:hypothetical protein
MGDKSGKAAERPGESTEFAPNENQFRALTAFQDCDYGCSVTQGMSAAGLHRTTWYAWTRRANFCRWWRDQAERWAAIHLPQVYGAMIARATGQSEAGSTAAGRLFLQRFDKHFAPRRRQDIRQRPTDGPDALDLESMSPDELARLEHTLGGGLSVQSGEQDAE